MLARMPPENRNSIALGSAHNAVLTKPLLNITKIAAPIKTPHERITTPDIGAIFASPAFSAIGAMPHTIAASIA